MLRSEQSTIGDATASISPGDDLCRRAENPPFHSLALGGLRCVYIIEREIDGVMRPSRHRFVVLEQTQPLTVPHRGVDPYGTAGTRPPTGGTLSRMPPPSIFLG